MNSPKDYLTDRVQEKINQIVMDTWKCRDCGGHKIEVFGKLESERILALLTNEVEKARKEKQKEQEWLLDYQRQELLEEVENKLLKPDEVVKTAKTVFDGTKECIYLARAALRAEQRKALSELKGGDTK